MKKKISLVSIVNSISNEKGISEEIIFNAIEEAIIYATTKKYGSINIVTNINNKNGTYKTFQILKVVSNSQEYNPLIEISLENAKDRNPKTKIGNFIKKEIKSIDFGRIEAQTAKHIIMKKVKNAEKNVIINEFKKKQKKLILCIVKKNNKNEIIVDLDNNVEGILKKNEIIQKDTFIPGNKILACLTNIEVSERGLEIYLSRTCKEMLTELLKREIPEINDGLIEIKDIAREAGIKSKISVKTNNEKLDPVGACIGIRGKRIQAISNELCGEKIDIILWDKNPIKYIINSLPQSNILSIEIDDDIKSMTLIVEKDNIAKIIGKNGGNIKLISKLIGWEINIISNDDSIKKKINEETYLLKLFTTKLNVNKNIALLLIKEGFTSLEEIAYFPNKDINKIKSIKNTDLINIKNEIKQSLLNKK